MWQPDPRFVLHGLAISDLNLRHIRRYLSRGMNPNVRNHSGDAPLHAAILSPNRNLRVIRELINGGADVDSQNNNSFTPLHYAVCFRNGEKVAILLQSGANVNVRSPRGFTALHFAIDNTEAECKYRVNRYTVDLKAHINIVRMLLNRENIDLCARNRGGITPLHTAVYSLETPCMRALLARGGNPSIAGPHKHTPLHSLLYKARFTKLYKSYMVMADLLLRHGADICSLNSVHKTPIDLLMEEIDDQKSLSFAKHFVKKVLLYRNVSQNEIAKLQQNPELASFMRICNTQLGLMMSQVVCGKITMHDFALGCFNDIQFHGEPRDPCLAIHKLLVDIIFTGVYSTYLEDILIQIPKPQLWDVLTYIVRLKNKRENFRNLDNIRFLKMCINSSSAMCDYMSHREIFNLILAESNLTKDQINALSPAEL